ncbi:hypothetical protein QAD02_006077 [Eretmocerus hayati]|uniref:Uncharacterized protein n=1 Tax=Eretmocerus hayati TaxID=131215 RepID=A0ACC2MZZ8_9HYME|nr:hypothetical protein QAD02_006077 [Eretmocerus hayati]
MSSDNEEQDVNNQLIKAVNAGLFEKTKELVNSYGLDHCAAWSGGYVLLRRAIQLKYVEIAKFLLEKNARVNSNNSKVFPSETPLHYAAKHGYLDIVESLLQKGARINDQDRNGQTPLHHAIDNKRTDVAEFLISRGADIYVTNSSGKSPLEYAINPDWAATIERALRPIRSEELNSPRLLHTAAEKGYLNIVEHLVESGTSVDTLHSKDDGLTTLHCAVKNNQEEVARFLLSNGADVNAQDVNGKSPVFYAIENNNFKITKLLLWQGADPETNPALFRAAVVKGCSETVETLLQFGADVNASDECGRTALHITSSGDIARLLVSRGANVEAQLIENGARPLHTATESGFATVVKALLESNADVNAQLKNETTALHIATENGFKNIVRMLLNYGAKIDADIRNGTTAMHMAAQRGHNEVIEILVDYGADIDAKDNYGKTPLLFAIRKGHAKTVLTLLENGSDIDTLHKEDLFIALNSSLFESPSFDETANALKCHMIKLMTAGVFVSKSSLLQMENSFEKSFQDKCKEEIIIMKRIIVDESNVSLYDYLMRDTNSLVARVKNERALQPFESGFYKTRFPIYAGMIGVRFRRCSKRAKLLKQGNKIFNFLSIELPELTHECTEKILTYLSDNDLKSLIDAFKIPSFSTDLAALILK